MINMEMSYFSAFRQLGDSNSTPEVNLAQDNWLNNRKCPDIAFESVLLAIVFWKVMNILLWFMHDYSFEKLLTIKLFT